MNAMAHSKFALPLAELIQADANECAANDKADQAGLPYGDLVAHSLIMAFPCNTLPEIRAKLAYMTENGTGLTGEEDAFVMMLADLDRIIAEGAE